MDRANFPKGGLPNESLVSVREAEAEFAELNRQLSGRSRPKTAGINQGLEKLNCDDIEKASPSEFENHFDLESTLRGRRIAEQEIGIHPKEAGVIWENLSVSAAHNTNNYVETLADIIAWLPKLTEKLRNHLDPSEVKEVNILKDFKGLAKPGEMVLVLGRPGAGCSTFLKVIANRRSEFAKVAGEVLYGPFDSETFSKRYRGEAVYNQEDDVHYPSLTVGQTLRFALGMKIPGRLPEGLSKDEFRGLVLKTLLKMFNMEHTVDTPVGDKSIRGISGGEKKRLSIAEMMITSATICAWDNSTRGLDASNALDFAKSLRIITNLYRTTTFASLYQVSESIYQQFDKVLVIDKGRQIYFGPTAEATWYFESIGFGRTARQTSADFLTSCTDDRERAYRSGINLEHIPQGSEALEAAFNNSASAKTLQQQMAFYRQTHLAEQDASRSFETAIRTSKHKHALNKSAYIIPYYKQVWVLMHRQFLIRWQNRLSLVMSFVTIVVVALLYGSLWFHLPETPDGAFTRSGLLFLLIVYNGFRAFAEIAITIFGRSIVSKHRAYAFHQLSALWTAQVLVDMLFASADITAYSIIIYFMCGLARSAGAFSIFLLITLSSYLAMTLLFRTIGCVCSTFDSAIKFAAMAMVSLLLTAGYLIQYSNGKVWLRWIFYINPLGLGFATLMVNEFTRINLTCPDSSLMPSGAGYTSPSNRACNIPGAEGGSRFVSGLDYIEYGFNYKASDLWRNYAILLVLIFFLFVANALLGELVTFNGSKRSNTIYVKRKNRQPDIVDPIPTKQSPIDPNPLLRSGRILTWENLSYEVKTPRGPRRLLDNIFGYIKPGELVALMGVSGAGKTTLLDVLAQRKNIGVISGKILVDGKPQGSQFQRSMAYAEQADVHEQMQTVREALRFSADLRQAIDIPQVEKYAYVEDVIRLLEMESIGDAVIGSSESGLGLEQQKRVTIGVELAAKPEILLFLDEPTSGLDSQSAYNLVRILRKLSAAGQAILCTVHQPNSTLFSSFDRLLLLQRGGQCVYFGDIGLDANCVLHYFSGHGAYCPHDVNPADWLLTTIGTGRDISGRNSRDWVKTWSSSQELANVKLEISRIQVSRAPAAEDTPTPTQHRAYASPIWHQLKTVHRRAHLTFWRSPNYTFTRLFLHVSMSLIIGLNFLNLGDSRSSVQDRVFVVFQVCIIPTIILAQVEPRYDAARLVYYREAGSKMYGQFAFASSLVMAEMLYSVLCAVVFFLPVYYMSGFQSAPRHAGYQFLMILVTEIFSVTLGQAIASLTPNNVISALMNPFLVVTMNLFCGASVPGPQIPGFYRAWLFPVNPLRRLIGGMAVTELHNLAVSCKQSEFIRFTAPPGQDCGSYMAAFFRSGGAGYLADNATNLCEYCSYSVGDQFLHTLDLNFHNRWRDLGIFAAFIGSNLLLLFIGSRFLFFNRR